MTRITGLLVLGLIAGLSHVSSGCSRSSASSSGDAATDADSDADSGTDVDSDSDADSETDTGPLPPWHETPIDDALRANWLDAADLDGDGDVDVLASCESEDVIVWWENLSGTGLTWEVHEIDEFSETTYAAAVDLDGDSDPDVLTRGSEPDNPWSSRVSWFDNTEGDGSTWVEREIVSYSPGYFFVRPFDIDGDDDPDVISAASQDCGLQWFENVAGDGSEWAPHEVDCSIDAVRAEGADLDGDGDGDIIGTGYTFDGFLPIYVWLNVDGQGDEWSFQDFIHHWSYYAWTASAADLDGDSDQDMLALGFGVSWLENTNGDGTVWESHNIDFPSSLYMVSCYLGISADLDGDSDVDLFAPCDNGDVWENDEGDATVWSGHELPNNWSIHALSLGDLDGDGDPDFIGSVWYESSVVWWNNDGF